MSMPMQCAVAREAEANLRAEVLVLTRVEKKDDGHVCACGGSRAAKAPRNQQRDNPFPGAASEGRTSRGGGQNARWK